MEPAQEYRMVFVTSSTYEQARQLARTLISEQLAACCNIIQGVSSVFGWHGTITEAQEFLLLIKTSAAVLNKLESRVTELHPYDVPEIVSIELSSSATPYLQWLQQSLQT